MTTRKNVYRLSLFLLILTFTAISCDWFTTTATPTPAIVVNVATNTPVTATNTSEPSTDTDDETSEGEATDTTSALESSYIPTPGTPSTNAYGSTCLVGTWRIYQPSVLTYIHTSMQHFGNNLFNATDVGGNISITFNDNGSFGLSAQDFTIRMDTLSGLFGDLLDMTFVIQASGAGNYTATDTLISTTNNVYDANAVIFKTPKDPDATSPITVSANLQDLINFAQSAGFAEDLDGNISSKKFKYNCTGDTMLAQINSVAYVTFFRLTE